MFWSQTFFLVCMNLNLKGSIYLITFIKGCCCCGNSHYIFITRCIKLISRGS